MKNKDYLWTKKTYEKETYERKKMTKKKQEYVPDKYGEKGKKIIRAENWKSRTVGQV